MAFEKKIDFQDYGKDGTRYGGKEKTKEGLAISSRVPETASGAVEANHDEKYLLLCCCERGKLPAIKSETRKAQAVRLEVRQ